MVGVRPDTGLEDSAWRSAGARHAIAVDRQMHTTVPDIFAAGDCVVTYHRLLGETHLPPRHHRPQAGTRRRGKRTRRHKRIRRQPWHPGRQGLRTRRRPDWAARPRGLSRLLDPVTTGSEADDHKAYYPGSHRIAMRFTGDKATGRLLGVQLFGHRHAEVAKRIDIAATAIFHGMTIDAISDLDLSYTPPLGSPWDAIQIGAQAWVRQSGSTVSSTR